MGNSQSENSQKSKNKKKQKKTEHSQNLDNYAYQDNSSFLINTDVEMKGLLYLEEEQFKKNKIIIKKFLTSDFPEISIQDQEEFCDNHPWLINDLVENNQDFNLSQQNSSQTQNTSQNSFGEEQKQIIKESIITFIEGKIARINEIKQLLYNNDNNKNNKSNNNKQQLNTNQNQNQNNEPIQLPKEYLFIEKMDQIVETIRNQKKSDQEINIQLEEHLGYFTQILHNITKNPQNEESRIVRLNFLQLRYWKELREALIILGFQKIPSENPDDFCQMILDSEKIEDIHKIYMYMELNYKQQVQKYQFKEKNIEKVNLNSIQQQNEHIQKILNSEQVNQEVLNIKKQEQQKFTKSNPEKDMNFINLSEFQKQQAQQIQQNMNINYNQNQNQIQAPQNLTLLQERVFYQQQRQQQQNNINQQQYTQNQNQNLNQQQYNQLYQNPQQQQYNKNLKEQHINPQNQNQQQVQYQQVQNQQQQQQQIQQQQPQMLQQQQQQQLQQTISPENMTPDQQRVYYMKQAQIERSKQVLTPEQIEFYKQQEQDFQKFGYKGIKMTDEQKKRKFVTMEALEVERIREDQRTLELLAWELSNKFRQENHLNQVLWSEEVSKICYEHSLNMGKGLVPFGHDGFNQRSQQIQRVCRVQRCCENVAYSNQYVNLAETIVKGWINSPGHRKNLLSPATHSGIGVYRAPDGKWYFTQIFICVA